MSQKEEERSISQILLEGAQNLDVKVRDHIVVEVGNLFGLYTNEKATKMLFFIPWFTEESYSAIQKAYEDAPGFSSARDLFQIYNYNMYCPKEVEMKMSTENFGMVSLLSKDVPLVDEKFKTFFGIQVLKKHLAEHFVEFQEIFETPTELSDFAFRQFCVSDGYTELSEKFQLKYNHFHVNKSNVQDSPGQHDPVTTEISNSPSHPPPVEGKGKERETPSLQVSQKTGEETVPVPIEPSSSIPVKQKFNLTIPGKQPSMEVTQKSSQPQQQSESVPTQEPHAAYQTKFGDIGSLLRSFSAVAPPKPVPTPKKPAKSLQEKLREEVLFAQNKIPMKIALTEEESKEEETFYSVSEKIYVSQFEGGRKNERYSSSYAYLMAQSGVKSGNKYFNDLTQAFNKCNFSMETKMVLFMYVGKFSLNADTFDAVLANNEKLIKESEEAARKRGDGFKDVKYWDSAGNIKIREAAPIFKTAIIALSANVQMKESITGANIIRQPFYESMKGDVEKNILIVGHGMERFVHTQAIWKIMSLETGKKFFAVQLHIAKKIMSYDKTLIPAGTLVNGRSRSSDYYQINNLPAQLNEMQQKQLEDALSGSPLNEVAKDAISRNTLYVMAHIFRIPSATNLTMCADVRQFSERRVYATALKEKACKDIMLMVGTKMDLSASANLDPKSEFMKEYWRCYKIITSTQRNLAMRLFPRKGGARTGSAYNSAPRVQLDDSAFTLDW